LWEKVARIELDQNIYGKAILTLYDKHGAMIERIFPKWNHRWVVLQQINKQWIEYLERKYNESSKTL